MGVVANWYVSFKCGSLHSCRYKDLLQGKMQVLLITNDRENQRKAQEDMGLEAMSSQAYAQSRTDCKDLIDIVVQHGGIDADQNGK